MFKDEEKKFDLRVVEKNIEHGIITREEYEAYLANLPDVSEKINGEYEFRFFPRRHEPVEASGSGPAAEDI